MRFAKLSCLVCRAYVTGSKDAYMRIAGALLAEKAEIRENGLYIEGGVYPALKQDPESGMLVVWLVLLVKRNNPEEGRTFKVEIEPLDADMRADRADNSLS